MATVLFTGLEMMAIMASGQCLPTHRTKERERMCVYVCLCESACVRVCVHKDPGQSCCLHGARLSEGCNNGGVGVEEVVTSHA